MAYRITQQMQNGKLLRKKVDRRWMMSVIRAQQEKLNQFAMLLDIARNRINELNANFPSIQPKTNQEQAADALDLGMPPLPVREPSVYPTQAEIVEDVVNRIEPPALSDEAREKVEAACSTQ